MPKITYIDKGEGSNLTPADVNEIKKVVNSNAYYDSTQVFNTNDLTTDSGKIIKSIIDNNVNAPVLDSTDTSWEKVNTSGATYDPEIKYKLNDITSYEGVLVKSIWDEVAQGTPNIGNTPNLTLGATDLYWEIVKTGGSVELDGLLGEDVTKGDALYFKADGKLYIGSSLELVSSFIAGLASVDSLAGTTISIVKFGELNGFTVEVGTDYYLGSDGKITTLGNLEYNQEKVYLGRATKVDTLDVSVRSPEPRMNYDGNIPIGTTIEYPMFKDLTAQGFVIYDFGNSISQANYPILFKEIGHKWNDAHVAAGDADLSASTTLFYPTPPPGFYTRIAIPDSASIDSTAAIDITNDTITLSASDYNRFKRMKYAVDSFNGVPVYLEGVVPTGLLEGTIYYIEFYDDVNYYIRLHTTEAGAITPDTPIDITAQIVGTFVLTQEGIVLDDTLQEHIHNRFSGQVIWNTGAGTVASGGLYGQRDTNTYGTGSATTNIFRSFGALRTSNETRPRTALMYKYVKAEYVTTAGEPISALRYDTGWIANSDWNLKILNINHPLNTDYTGLNIKVYIKDENGIEVLVLNTNTGTSSYDRGLSIQPVDENNFKLVFGEYGLTFYADDGTGTVGIQSVAGTDAGYYRVIMEKPNLVSTVFDVSAMRKEYDISTVDQVMTLPIPTGVTQIREAEWINGDGTAKLTFSVPDSSGVYTTSEYVGEGNGKIKWETTQLSTGGYGWKVVDYEDGDIDWHIIGDTGEPAFQNSWVNYNSDENKAGFKRIKTLNTDTVYIKGTVVGGASNTIVFTLPYFIPYFYRIGGENLTGTFYIQTTGDVLIRDAGSDWSAINTVIQLV